MRIQAWKIGLSLICILGIAIFMLNLEKNIINRKPLHVWTRFKPSSTDPMKYDLSVHHITMRSVMASLVSVYKNGEIAPQIALKWVKSDDSKVWRITLDPKWKFENGDKVTAEVVVKNFIRVILLKNQENSKSGFLEFLQDSEKIKSLDQSFEGISIIEGDVLFKFVRPMPDFLEKVSFGLYSIAHPNDYHENGKWKDDRNVIASGHYRIQNWNEENFILELRPDFHDLNENKRIRNVVFSFSNDISEIKKSDIMIREKLNPYVEPAEWTFASTTQDNNITYIKVMKWDDSKSVLSDKKTRTILRNIFYDSLEKSGLSATKSFFPLSIKNIKEFSYDHNSFFNFHNKEFTTQPFFTSANLKTESKKELGDIYNDAFQLFCTKVNAVAKNVDYPALESDERKVFDIQFLGTGILIDSPKDDIRFMFMSKQGIQLPDESGEIKTKLSQDDFDVQEINKLLWDQAIIWPVRHYSMGFWTNNSSNIDVSNLNLTLHPIDFQFLYWK